MLMGDCAINHKLQLEECVSIFFYKAFWTIFPWDLSKLFQALSFTHHAPTLLLLAEFFRKLTAFRYQRKFWRI